MVLEHLLEEGGRRGKEEKAEVREEDRRHAEQREEMRSMVKGYAKVLASVGHDRVGCLAGNWIGMVLG